MSSDNKKIFTTQASSKAADQDIVSDVIAMPNATSGHVLSVKTDASCTGVVDVELEMSPDGTNWCPAVTRTVSASVTQTEPRIGNEEYVKLTPDAGEFKNKHARGGLNFDVNGAVVTPDGTGARDLMHQHIAVNKSFNYSQWFKTSEAPTTTYKPVLFRHGGYDNFENLKVVDLTDSQTQNLVESKSTFSTQANKLVPAYTGSGGVVARPNTPAATFYGSSGQVDNGAESDIGKHLTGVWNPHEDFSTSRWIFQNNAAVAGFRHRAGITFGYPSINYATSTYIRFYGGIEFSPFVTYSNTDAAEKILPVRAVITGQSGSYWYVYNSNPVLEFTRRSDNTTFTVNPFTGYHVAIAYTAPADITQGIPEANLAMYVNGERVKILTTTENNVDYAYGAAPADALFNGDESFGANSNWAGRQFLDYGTTYTFNTIINNHMDFQGRVLSESDILKLYNDGKLLDFSNMQTSFPISLSNCVGAYDADVTYVYPGTSHVQGLEDCSGYGKDIQLMASSVGGCTSSLISPTLSYNASPENLLAGKFTTTSNLSISGWFKTTDTGVLFSNTEGDVSTTGNGMALDIDSSGTQIVFVDAGISSLNTSTPVNDGNWHHIALVLEPGHSTKKQKIYIDGTEAVSGNLSLTTDARLKGSNGFTLLSDGQNNAHAASPSATDASKLNASLSNWSIHGEALSDIAIKQIYSNGHVRNIKNLPEVNVAQIAAWWQLADTTNPENDVAASVDLLYQDGNSETLVAQLTDATGATLIEDSINGNAMTLSLTKSFNFTTNEWVETADQETALCLSFNGFEEQAEHVALWKCSQTIAGSTIDICDGGWHNVILSYRGNNDLAGDNVAEGDTVKFGPGPAQSLPFNWCMSYDGQPLTAIKDGSGADYIDGLGATVTDTYNSVSYNVGFAIHNRHMRYETSNTEEVYKPHAQFSAGIHEVTGIDNNTAFQGSVDETSFHSDCWWVDQAGTSITSNTFNQEKPATIYGSTTALTDRGAGTAYPEGVPYPLTSPGEIGSARGGNQWINPYRKGEVQEDTNTSIGGVEGWWRWGDTPGDCSVTINDVKDHDASINARDIDAFGIVTADRQDMSVNAESIYNEDIASGAATGNVAITFPQIVVSGIQAGICNVKQITSPILKYLRVKFTGAGSCDLGESSTQAQINFRVKE